MDYKRNPQRLERTPSEFRSMSAGGWRQILAVHVREVDTRLFEHRALGKHARAPATTLRSLPFLLAEALAAICPLERYADAVLQVEQVVLDTVDVGRAHPYPPGTLRDYRA